MLASDLSERTGSIQEQELHKHNDEYSRQSKITFKEQRRAPR